MEVRTGGRDFAVGTLYWVSLVRVESAVLYAKVVRRGSINEIKI